MKFGNLRFQVARGLETKDNGRYIIYICRVQSCHSPYQHKIFRRRRSTRIISNTVLAVLTAQWKGRDLGNMPIFCALLLLEASFRISQPEDHVHTLVHRQVVARCD